MAPHTLMAGCASALRCVALRARGCCALLANRRPPLPRYGIRRRSASRSGSRTLTHSSGNVSGGASAALLASFRQSDVVYS